MTTLPFAIGTASGRVLDLIFVALLCGGGWLGPKLYRIWTTDLTAAQRALIEKVLADAISYAEQYFATSTGAQKRQNAIAWATKELARLGIALPPEETLLGILQTVYAGLKSSGVLAASAPAPVAPTPAAK